MGKKLSSARAINRGGGLFIMLEYKKLAIKLFYAILYILTL